VRFRGGIGSAHVLALVAIVLAAGGFAVAAIPSGNGTIKGCFKKSGKAKGTLRVIDERARCKRTERQLTWNQRGVPGAPGAPGAPGSDAQFNGAAAGGALNGTFPNPGLAGGSVTADKFGALPGARISRAAAQSIPNDSETVVALDTPGFTSGGTTVNLTNGTITVPRTGKYIVTGLVSWAAGTAGSRSTILTINTTGVLARGGAAADALDNAQIGANTVVHLDAGDVIGMNARQENAGAASVNTVGGLAQTLLSLHWLGP
jgi:hypothetical protein